MARRTRGTTSLKPLGPLSGASERLQILERAGFTPEAKANLLRDALVTAKELLTATVPIYSHTGNLVGERPDWSARAKGLRSIIDLTDAAPSKSAQTGAKTYITIAPDAAPWSPPKNVTPVKAEPS